MKLLRINWLAIIFAAVFFALSSGVTSAAAPHIYGYVKNKDTGEGIPGMVVRWEDNADAKPNHGGSNGVRYAVTGADGKFFFPSWHLPPEDGGIGTEDLREAEHDKRIDTNYDGNPDADLVSEDEGLFFGCGENPHTFTLMLPRPGFDGQFEPQKIETELINGNYDLNIGTFNYTPTTPRCPGNIRHSCDTENSTATVTWDQPGGGATGYRMYIDKSPLGVESSGDRLHDNTSNQLSRTFDISLSTDYLVRVRTVRDSKESESCLMQFRCEPPPCAPGECCPPGQTCQKAPPKATLSWCAQPTDSHYLYTISNIDTDGLPLVYSRLMITFSLNAQTQQILNYLTNSSNSSTADFSLWNERNRQKQTGDYFGFYIQTFNSLSGSSLPYQITPNTRIGQRTMAEFRQYLIDNNLPLQHPIKANMMTRNGDVNLFNSHIPAPSNIDLSKDFSATCTECPGGICPPPNSCPLITITQPAENEVLTLVNNTVTVEWTAPDAQPGTQYEVMIYDRNNYNTPQEAYQAYEVGVAVPIAMPNDLIVYKTSNTSQVVNFGHIDGLDPQYWAIAVRSTTCLNGWVNTTPPPPGFPVSGKIYRYNPSCQPLEEVPIGGTISATGGHVFPVVSGSYSSSLPDSGTNYALQLTLADDTFDCANICGQGPSCVRDNINPTNNTANFFVREENIFTKSWWQVYGGFVFARNVMNSELPITDDNQSWRLMPALLSGTPETAGIPLTNRNRFGNDAPDNTNVAGWLREPPLQVPSANINESIKPDFSYYRDKLGLPETRLPEIVNQVSQLNGQNKNGVIVHYREGNLTFAPNSSWNVGGNQHHVVLVQGNITISADNLTGTDVVVSTQLGSTTTFVATGSITIAGNVGNTDIGSLNPNLSGIFIANQITIQDDGNASIEDKRFVGQGSFIGWNNVSLQRHFDDFALNENTPAETFIARPDFVINLPEAIKDSSITWQEVN